MLDNPATTGAEPSKRKRRPAGTPDPEAEVVALSPETLLESDRYVCEICNQGFQRDQNLQMHRRRHKVPWKLLKRETAEVKKRVFVCPEPTCLHHHPSHALGDLVGIKKHFRRKHSSHKQWVCHRCSKAYAVQSDFKAHLKTCGTRGHSCDCGRVFSRVESFIEHQDSCTVRSTVQPAVQPACSSRTASSTSPSSEANLSRAPPPPTLLAGLATPRPAELQNEHHHHHQQQQHHNLELQLLPSSCRSISHNMDEDLLSAPCLKLSIGSSPQRERNQEHCYYNMEAARLREQAGEQLRMAAAEKAYADEARQEARKQVEAAEVEFATAQRMRREAQAELEKAELVRDQASKRVSSIVMDITCHACKKHFHSSSAAPDETSFATISYLSSATDS